MIITHKLTHFAVAVATALLLCLNFPSASAHQAVSPKILKMVKKGPPGTAPCYVDGSPTAECIEKGRKLFESETFGGNGRTCASCHPASNNFTLDVPFISTLPDTDKLFVHEQVQALEELETPLLRKYGLICENLDGFANENNMRSCVMRSVIATEGLKTTTSPDAGPFDSEPASSPFTPARPLFPLKGTLGWAGDGAPGEGTLREFAIGAVVQHFPRTLQRTNGIDFVLPTEDELDAMEAFQLSLGRQEELNLNPDPFARNKSFNCVNYDGDSENDCATAPVFQLKTMNFLLEKRTGSFVGPLVTFNDDVVMRGQLLFFGGFPSRPGVDGQATNIRTCSGCHIQAGAGSAAALNTPLPAANRQRATGASDAPNSPVCLPEAQGVIFNADGGFGAGENGFPSRQDGSAQGCVSNGFSSVFFPSGSCFKEFTKTTQPPLSNPGIGDPAKNADVGRRNTVQRKVLCGGDAADPIVFTGTGFFSTPSIVEAASTIPLFHNNIAATVEDSVSFYATGVFNDSASGAGNRLVLENAPDGAGGTLDIPHDIGASPCAPSTRSTI